MVVTYHHVSLNRCIAPTLAGEIWDICTMLVLVPTHVWERVIPGVGVEETLIGHSTGEVGS